MKKFALLGLAFIAAPFYIFPGPESTSSPTAPEPSRAPASLPSPVVAPADTPSVPEKIRYFSTALEETHQCYERDCDFPRTDARSYDFAVGQALRRDLLQFGDWARVNHVVDRNVGDIAALYLQTEDGHVQEAALALLATQPTDPATLDQILQHVIGGYDAQLIPQAMQELARYQSTDEQAKITAALANAMATGSPFVAKEISAGITPFVQPASVSTFEDLAANLPDGSQIKSNLERALR